MTFFVVTGIVGAILMGSSIFFGQYFRRKWRMLKGMFFRAGLVALVIQMFHFSVLDGLLSWLPGLVDLPSMGRAAIFGVSGALFIELGRFFVLDKMFKKTRSWREGIYFGLGWSSIATFLVGLFLVVGAFGLQYLLNAPDLSAVLPDASTEELEQAEELRTFAESLVAEGTPAAFLPLFERGAAYLVDIVLTVLILFGFGLGTTAYVWLAVAFHALFLTGVAIAETAGVFIGMGVLVIFSGLSYYFYLQISKSFPK